MSTAATEAVQAVHPRTNGENRRPAPYKTPAALVGMKEKERPAVSTSELPRSASYTYMPNAVHRQKYVNTNILAIKGSFAEADLSTSDDAADGSPPDSSGWNTPDELDLRSRTEPARDLAAELNRNPKIVVQKQSDEEEAKRDSAGPRALANSNAEDNGGDRPKLTSSTSDVTTRPRAATASNLAKKLNRRSWVPGVSRSNSRSPSPVKQQTTVPRSQPNNQDDAQNTPPSGLARLGSRRSFLKRKDSIKPSKSNDQSNADSTLAAPSADTSPERRPSPLRRKSISLRNKLAKPPGTLFRSKNSDEGLQPPVPPVPVAPSFHKSFSTDRLPIARNSAQYDHNTPVPRLVSGDRSFSGSPISLSKKKDELWSVFRALDGDYAKFSSKSVALKANVLRSTLLPFLRQYASHPSNSKLRPEDLDRRANILNKWWGGLLEMLHGRNNQSISGTDRPAILDGISGIMERPEWRLPPSPFTALNPTDLRVRSRSDQSRTSASSSASDFLTESVHHNVRNTFLQNLSAQMAFVVDKMTMRNASASLVTFCGKACAYAFMFVPGMADILIRLWDLPMDTLRRVLDENGIGKFAKLGDTSQSILSYFPPALHSLEFVSLANTMRKLRTPPPLPLGTNHINWWGYWVERWTGRESDLFYVFVKHFHILVADFLPAGSSKTERMCVPGLILVHGQILTNLDSTIHRDAKPSGKDSGSSGSSPTFDDVFAGPDAVASSIPSLPANATRTMAENRLIMLIRDFISERAGDHPMARQLFAESFNDLLQCATRRTSVFDHSACYTLLDFLEEALVILARFENIDGTQGPLIDSQFWTAVCKKMASSENTLTEIRLYAFLYTIWSIMASDPRRKADICVGFLLDPAIFESRFNHWCPMVRAYYMRLLCWRVGRHDGDAAKCDLQILGTMHDYLALTWSHYLWLREDATGRQVTLPPTNPCNPAPCRRLLIIRTDKPTNIGGSFISFDGIVPPNPSSHMSSVKRFSESNSLMDIDSRPSSSNSDESGSPPTGIRSMIRNMMTSRNRPKSPARSPSDPQTSRADAINDAQHAALNRSPSQDRHRNVAPTTLTSTDSAAASRPGSAASNVNLHHNCSFKFSLDFHPTAKAPGQIRLFPPRLPKPAQEYLQSRTSKGNGAQHLQAVEPKGTSREHARYTGRALAEWMMVVGECQSFFERRKNEGVPENRFVETPSMGVEVFRKGA
ncbi:hypothetical protein Q7P37_003474 [Cladosporium fusiforme]